MDRQATRSSTRSSTDGQNNPIITNDQPNDIAIANNTTMANDEHDDPAVGEGGCTPKPKPKRTYNTSGLRKKKRKFAHTKKSDKKQSSFDLDSIRVQMGNPKANAQEIRSYLDPAPDRQPSKRSPSKVTVKRERSYYRGALQRLEKLYEKRGARLERLAADKKGLLKRIKAEAKASEEYTSSIVRDADAIYSDAHRLMEDANAKQR